MMADRNVYLIRCYDMGYFEIQGVFETVEKAESVLIRIVEDVNAKIIKGNRNYETLFEQSAIEDDGSRVLAKYANRHRVIDIQEFQLNKSYDGITGWYEYFDDDVDAAMIVPKN